MNPKTPKATTPSVPPDIRQPSADPQKIRELLSSPKDSSDYWQGYWQLWQKKRQQARKQ